jgi:hypothetical protein
MPDPVVALLVWALGFVLGAWVGTAIVLRIIAARRTLAATGATFARLFPSDLPERSAADILAGVVRVSIGGGLYELPTLPMEASERWLASLDERFAAVASGIESSGDDLAAKLAILMSGQDAMLDALYAYDRSQVLPPREEAERNATKTEILRAVIEVWRAEHPLAATLAETGSLTSWLPSALPSSSPPPTAGTPEPSGSG